MFGLRLRLSVLFGACLGSFMLGEGQTWASTFQVSPVRLPLTAAAQNGLLTVTNRSNETLRFQVTGFTWSQSPTGEMVLSPTTDIVFFPTLLSVKAGASRSLRVGATVPFGSSEKTYRVFVEELPPAESTSNGSSIRVLTRMGIPVFLVPDHPNAAPAIDSLAMQGQRLAFALHDKGNAHFMTKRVQVSALGAGGEALFEQELPGWYVLSGGFRRYGLDLPDSACSAAKIRVRVETDQTTLESLLAVPSSACSR